MMRILMASIVDPAFQWGGAWTATRGVLSLLREPPFNAEVVSITAADPPSPSRQARRYLALARSLVSGLPAKFQFQYSRKVLESATSRLRDEVFDLILLNGSDLLWMLPHLPQSPPRIVIAHNIEHHLYADQIRLLYPQPGFQRAVLLKDHSRLLGQELAGLCAVGNVIFLSAEDEAYARQACPQLTTISIPPLVPAAGTPRARNLGDASEIDIGMLANFEWWPSLEGARWFLREVLPNLRPGIRVHFFGKRSESLPTDDARAVKHGYTADLGLVWSTCHFMICPVFAGGGVSVKLVDPVCRGVPVLATHYSVRGLPIKPDDAIVLRDTAVEWIEFLNSGAARRLGTLSPSPEVMGQFHPSSHVERFACFLQTVLPGAAGPHVRAGCREA